MVEDLDLAEQGSRDLRSFPLCELCPSATNSVSMFVERIVLLTGRTKVCAEVAWCFRLSLAWY
jgi:hypothetical protein